LVSNHATGALADVLNVDLDDQYSSIFTVTGNTQGIAAGRSSTLTLAG
jgi:hypothetical protein